MVGFLAMGLAQSAAAKVIPEIGRQRNEIRPEKPRHGSRVAADELDSAEIRDGEASCRNTMWCAGEDSITSALPARAYGAQWPDRMFAGLAFRWQPNPRGWGGVSPR